MDNSINFTRLIEQNYKCPECGSQDIKEDIQRAEVYCSNCGLVICDPTIDDTPEPYDYTEQKNTNPALS